ncbi:MAG: hypothetical protein QOH26_7, partial [Actinomycetota bacterium]|nr:hypothetical protein [Actinomycetota bacterium]
MVEPVAYARTGGSRLFLPDGATVDVIRDHASAPLVVLRPIAGAPIVGSFEPTDADQRSRFVASLNGHAAEAGRCLGLAAEALGEIDACDHGEPAGSTEPVPYPIHVLPDAIRRFVEQGAEARGIPPEYIALPLLGFAGAAIGNRLALELKGGWVERPILWTAIVGPPGCGKTPGMKYAQAPLDAIQSALYSAYEGERQRAEQERPRDGGRAVLPRLTSIYTTDATLEAVADVLGRAKGLVMIRDEIAGWAAAFDQYRQGGDRQSWLSLWSGTPLKIDRKTSPPVYVPAPVVCVVGGVQPDRLSDLRGGTVDDGFADRFLLAWPTALPQKWSDRADDPASVEAVRILFEAIHARWESTHPPDIVRFSARARAAFQRFFDDNAAAQGLTTGLAAGWASKAPSHLARIALILHALKNAEEPARDLSESTVDAAIALLEYHRAHFARCLPRMGSSGRSVPAGNAGRVLRCLERGASLQENAGWLRRSDLMQQTRLDASQLSAA